MNRELDLPWARIVEDLRRFVRRRVADPEAVDDLVQDIVGKLAAGLRGRSPGGDLRAFMLAVARHAIIDHYRRRRRQLPLADGGEPVAAAEPGPERRALLSSFRAFVHALPPEQREAVLRTEYDGISQAELARELGVPVSTVKSRVQRGRQRLAQALHDCCVFEFDRRGQIVDWQRRPGGACRDC